MPLQIELYKHMQVKVQFVTTAQEKEKANINKKAIIFLLPHFRIVRRNEGAIAYRKALSPLLCQKFEKLKISDLHFLFPNAKMYLHGTTPTL